MTTVRKFTAAALGACALFFACGLLLAPPANLAVSAILGVQALAMIAGAAMLWPRAARLDLARLIGDERQKPKGPAPLRFGLGRYVPDLSFRPR